MHGRACCKNVASEAPKAGPRVTRSGAVPAERIQHEDFDASNSEVTEVGGDSVVCG